MRKLLSPSAVAALVGCSGSTVNQAIRSGDLKATAIVGPSGSVTGYGVAKRDAEAWDPRPVGRPRVRPAV